LVPDELRRAIGTPLAADARNTAGYRVVALASAGGRLDQVSTADATCGGPLDQLGTAPPGQHHECNRGPRAQAETSALKQFGRIRGKKDAVDDKKEPLTGMTTIGCSPIAARPVPQAAW